MFYFRSQIFIGLPCLFQTTIRHNILKQIYFPVIKSNFKSLIIRYYYSRENQFLRGYLQLLIKYMQQFNLSGYSQINERFYYNRFIRLGTGAFGSVFKGYDSKEKRFIAVKQIPRTQLYGPPDQELKQIQIMKMLNHKNIMAFYGSHGGRMNPQGIFMFVQLCDKGTLSHEIAKKMTEKRANQLFCQLVDGMAYMHEKGIYHRDLKPDNLLITQSGQLKIADFGIAKQVSNHATFKKCTPVYSAPEVYLQQIYQKNNQTYNLKCDVFSAGYILYEMLTSEQLNKGVKTSEDLRRFLLDKRNGGFKIQHPALTQKHWIDLLRNMLSFDPSNRPTFKDIKNNLKKFLPGIDQLPKTRPQSNDQIKKSQVLVKQVKNFFEAVNRRNTYLVNVLKILSLYQQQTSKLIPRVYQILILYFTLARYCYLSEEGLKMISDKENLAIPKTNLSLFSIEEELTLSDKVLLNSFIKSFTSRISEGIQQMKVFVSNNIITELQKILRENETSLQRKVVKEFNIENNLKGFKLNEFEVDSFYKMGMKRCINNLYRTSAEIVILSEQDLRVYLISLYVANSDQFFDQMTYQRKPSLPSIQQILKMDRSKLQQAISIQKNKD